MGKIIVQRDVFGIQGLCVIEPKMFEDNRGYLFEAYNESDFFEAGLDFHFVQDNEVHSKKGVLRGCHVNRKHPQGKLVRVLSGIIFDVVIDLRKGSSTFKKWCGIKLSSKNKKQLYIPEGMGHGYLAMSDADILFKVTKHFIPGDEVGFAWNSSEIGIQWPDIGMDYIMNANDKSNCDFSELKL